MATTRRNPSSTPMRQAVGNESRIFSPSCPSLAFPSLSMVNYKAPLLRWVGCTVDSLLVSWYAAVDWFSGCHSEYRAHSCRDCIQDICFNVAAGRDSVFLLLALSGSVSAPPPSSIVTVALHYHCLAEGDDSNVVVKLNLHMPALSLRGPSSSRRLPEAAKDEAVSVAANGNKRIFRLSTMLCLEHFMDLVITFCICFFRNSVIYKLYNSASRWRMTAAGHVGKYSRRALNSIRCSCTHTFHTHASLPVQIDTSPSPSVCLHGCVIFQEWGCISGCNFQPREKSHHDCMRASPTKFMHCSSIVPRCSGFGCYQQQTEHGCRDHFRDHALHRHMLLSTHVLSHSKQTDVVRSIFDFAHADADYNITTW